MSQFLSIQKPDIRHFSGFVATLKPDNFDGSNYKWWRARMILWLAAMSCYPAAERKPEQFTPEEEQKFMAANNLFRGTVISALDKNYIDNYIICTTAKELWDALEAKFGVFYAGSEVYLIE